jgi:hypothetical protein
MEALQSNALNELERPAMSDAEIKGAKRTAFGREELLEEHERRLDDLDGRVKTIEGKEQTRDKRWDLVLKSVVTIGAGIIIAVVSALVAGGHP